MAKRPKAAATTSVAKEVVAHAEAVVQRAREITMITSDPASGVSELLALKLKLESIGTSTLLEPRSAPSAISVTIAPPLSAVRVVGPPEVHQVVTPRHVFSTVFARLRPGP